MNISSVNLNSMDYGKLASGKRINSAADDAAGLAIAQKMQSQSNGYDVGASNIKDGISLANVQDGALSTMQDSLQRIKELSIKASNGIYSDSDKEMIQTEIDQLLQDVERTATSTTFNEMSLLGGSMADIHIASNPDGSGMQIQLENTTLKALGLEGYSVAGSFDMGVLDKAMEQISAARSRTGATTNALGHAYNYNTGASLETTSARSRIEDLDMPKAISEQKKKELLSNYRMGMLKKKMEDDSLVNKMFDSL